MFTKSQLQWASEHDWFIHGNANEIFTDTGERFTNFRQLKIWAGY